MQGFSTESPQAPRDAWMVRNLHHCRTRAGVQSNVPRSGTGVGVVVLAPSGGDFALKNMTAIDATGLHELERLAERLRATGRTLLLCGVRSQPDQLLRQSDFIQFLGEENMLPHVEAALSRAREIHEGRSAAPGTNVPRVDRAVSRA